MNMVSLIKVRKVIMYVIPITLITIITLSVGVSSAKATKYMEEYGRGVLVKVVDGDTLKLNVNGVISNYRLAAIDTPETYNNIKAKKDITKCGIAKETMFALGGLAKQYVKDRYSPGDIIEYYKVGVGRYHRSIIWVYGITPNLIKSGLARVLDYRNVTPSKIKYLKKLESEAIDSNIGIWLQLGCWK